MKTQAIKKLVNKSRLALVAAFVIGTSFLVPSPAQARSSWYVGFSTGPVWVGGPYCYPAPVVYYRPTYYYVEPCPPPVVYYPAPVISVGYWSYHHHRR